MNALIKFEFNRWTIARADAANIWRIQDIDLAKRLGHKRPRRIRQLIKRTSDKDELRLSDTDRNGEVLMRPRRAAHRELWGNWGNRRDHLCGCPGRENLPLGFRGPSGGRARNLRDTSRARCGIPKCPANTTIHQSARSRP